MLLEKERQLVTDYGRKLVQEGLTVGTFGNISVYCADRGLMAITPSGLDYMVMKPEDVVIMTPDGEKLEGDRKPSSEYDMHRIFYQKRRGINAVVHTHSRFAATLACLNWSIPPVHYLAAYCGRDVPCAEYAPFGTYSLAESAYEAMENDRYACLLGNHGLLAVGGSLAYAFDVAQQIEFLAEIYYRGRVAGEPVILGEEQIAGALEAFKTYRTV